MYALCPWHTYISGKALMPVLQLLHNFGFTHSSTLKMLQTQSSSAKCVVVVGNAC